MEQLVSLPRYHFFSNSPYCLPHSSYAFSVENLAFDQLIFFLLIFFFILITSLLDIVMLL